MVMKNIMGKNLLKSIQGSLGRFIAIIMIIALGCTMFIGLRMTRTDMVKTGEAYMDRQNLFDLRLLTAYGWGIEQVEKVRSLPGVQDAEGIFYQDYMVALSGDSREAVYRIYTLPQRLDLPVLREGRMPENENECLADVYLAGEEILGTQITVLESNTEESLEVLKSREFTVVGLVSTPLYVDRTRGNTSVGNGSIANFLFIPQEAVDADYYTEIHVALPGNSRIYTKAYHDAMTQGAEDLKAPLEGLAQERLNEVRQKAKDAYFDGLQEYADGYSTFAEEKIKAEKELSDGLQTITDTGETLRRSEDLLDYGEEQLSAGRLKLLEAKQTLAQSKQDLALGKSQAMIQLAAEAGNVQQTVSDLSTRNTEIDGEIIACNTELIQVNTQTADKQLSLLPIDTELSTLDGRIQLIETQIRLGEITGEDTSALLEELDSLNAQKTALQDERGQIQGELDELLSQQQSLEQEIQALQQEREDNSTAITQLLESSARAAVEALATFASAEALITAGEAQIAENELLLEEQALQLEDNRDTLEEGKADWLQGRKSYFTARADAVRKIKDGQQTLDDALEVLGDAAATIRDMTENTPIILDRTSNMGYNSLDSASGIVSGVSKVFPVFFILVAALICITTMTRMVDEERTQIGTLKAMGYSNAAIIRKYLVYAGSSTILGCILGSLAGCLVFPSLLWQAYKIMLYIEPQVTLVVDWPLILGVSFVYLGIMELVTWNCCRQTLREVPAELIRPKAPTSGKSLQIERLAIWKKLSFLNKVAIRNIFRYRGRLVMMLLGIGGCAGLLLTGYGIRDTIADVVDVQFEEVTVYDLQVYFRKDQTEDEQQAFLEKMGASVDGALFYDQCSVELDGAAQTKEIYLMVSDEKLQQFVDIHWKGKPVPMPGPGEALLSVGVAETLGISSGDCVTLRNSDMELMEVTVSDIYENHLNNYAIITPQTMKDGWGREPEAKMAFLNVAQDTMPYQVGAKASGLDGVMSVSVNEEMASMVDKMMTAMDFVVILIVFCAGLLAIVVLYNLTNINITERLREIATIKVLGFLPGETAMYIFKENLWLSVAGSLFGMVLGRALLWFVINQIKLDFMWLSPRLTPLSYALSIAITLVTAVAVDVVFYFKLDSINMTEALKSVE